MLGQTRDTEWINIHIQFVEEKTFLNPFFGCGADWIDRQGQVLDRQVADVPLQLAFTTLQHLRNTMKASFWGLLGLNFGNLIF